MNYKDTTSEVRRAYVDQLGTVSIEVFLLNRGITVFRSYGDLAAAQPIDWESGYAIVSPGGGLIKVVEPSCTPEELKAIREQSKWFDRQTFCSPDDNSLL